MTLSLEHTGLSFDAGELFHSFSVYPGTPNEISIRVPEGISPVSLRNSDIGKQLIHQDVKWYDSLPWAHETIPSGVYRLRLPIPGSNDKTFKEQKALLQEGWDVAPLVLVELAMLCLKKANLPDPLCGGWVRCRETAAVGGCRVGLAWHDGRLNVSYRWDDNRYDGASGSRQFAGLPDPCPSSP